MQTFYPWGKEILGFQLEENILEQLRGLSQLCQSYYLGIEKRRNGSIEESFQSVEIKDEILSKSDQISEQIKSQESFYSCMLDNLFMKQSFIAAMIAHTLDFDYRVLHVTNFNGKCVVRGMIRDRSGNKIESLGDSDQFQSGDPVQSMGAFYMASKKAFVSAVSHLSELDIISKVSEVLI